MIPQKQRFASPARADGYYYACLGSLPCRVRAENPRYSQMIAEVFGTDLVRFRPGGASGTDLEITIQDEPSNDHCRADDRLWITQRDRSYTFHTDPLTCFAEQPGQQWQLRFLVRQAEMAKEHLAYHFWIILNTVLLLIHGRVLLHAAAVRFGNAVLLFLGPKGVGKTTLAAYLVKEGGILLAEDHVHVRRDGETWLVSGCSGRLRMTEETERFLFRSPPPGTTVYAGGVQKRDIDARLFFPTRPHEDYPVDRLYFVSRGACLEAHRLNPRNTVLELIGNTVKMYRFTRKEDHARLLDLLAALAAKLPAYSLGIPDGLNELGRLAAFLKEPCPAD